MSEPLDIKASVDALIRNDWGALALNIVKTAPASQGAEAIARHVERHMLKCRDMWLAQGRREARQLAVSSARGLAESLAGRLRHEVDNFQRRCEEHTRELTEGK